MGRQLDGDHPEEQGLKLHHRRDDVWHYKLDGDHPEEQGLKHKKPVIIEAGSFLDGDHPEEQGLKLDSVTVAVQVLVALMGIIQKNKD